MREHPIPQDITGYRFHIIGSMTIKQFAEIAGGVGLGFLVFTLFPAFIGVPFGILFAVVGAAAAFVPFENRPLDHWIVTFFQTLYKPTQFYWRREAFIPSAFQYTPSQDYAQLEPEVDLTPARREQIKEYLFSLQTAPPSKTALTPEEVSRVQSIVESFDSVDVSNLPVTTQATIQKPTLSVRVRKLRPIEEFQVYPEDTTPLEPVVEVVEEPVDTPPEAVAADSIPAPEAAPSFAPQPTLQSRSAAEAAAFNEALPFPSPPTEPNKLVGMVLTPNNDLVTDAVVEIITTSGQTVRAVKSNALGQFFVSTPLPPGEYIIQVEKSGLDFEPVGLTLENTIITPLELRSNS